MNRLILIGNGFDLAHGLKTTYNDFMMWYLIDCFKQARDDDYIDELIEVSKTDRFYDFPHGDIDISALIQRYYSKGFDSILTGTWVVGYKDKDEPFNVNVKSKLFETLLRNFSYTLWVDIEREYYELLKIYLDAKGSALKTKEHDINQLNLSLEYIITKLHQYLYQLPTPDQDNRYVDILSSRINGYEVHNHTEYGTPVTDEMIFPVEKTYILNFNYTDTIEHYVNLLDRNFEIDVNYIHGKLNELSNPIIFGFGDELDDAYLRMEHERTKGFFKYIKSFWYFRTSNYRNLVRFIDSNSYQVFIIGHSCGLSDRTMLHMIFEHPNCKSIKIYYHRDEKKSNYTDLTYEIARHFKDKGEMRKRIVPFDTSKPMPQL